MKPEQHEASSRPPGAGQDSEEAANAIRFLAIKAAIFIGVPLVAAVVAALAIVWR